MDRSFLLDRHKRVMVAGNGLNRAPVLSRVLQGSVLGPVLFICYTRTDGRTDIITSFTTFNTALA